MYHFENTENLIIKFECKGSRIAKTILKRKNKIGGLTLLIFKTYYKDTVTTKTCFLYKDMHIDKWNRTESGKNLFIHGQLIFNKGTKAIQ